MPRPKTSPNAARWRVERLAPQLKSRSTQSAVNSAVMLRIFAVVLCAQNVALRPRAPAATRARAPDPLARRTVRAVTASVSAPHAAPNRLSR